jgi:hypothetical protein
MATFFYINLRRHGGRRWFEGEERTHNIGVGVQWFVHYSFYIHGLWEKKCKRSKEKKRKINNFF